MLITSAKPTLPGEPFGLSAGFSTVKPGDQYTARHGFLYMGAMVPRGSVATVVERAPYSRIELSFPDKELVN